MSDYDSHHARHHGRAMDYTDIGSGKGLWIGIALVAVLAVIGLIMAGGGGTADGTAPAAIEPGAAEPNAIAPAAGDAAPATGTVTTE